MTDHVEIRAQTYHDSVRLMQASAAAQQVPGVTSALVAMGTELNLSLLEDLGFADTTAGPDDLIVAVRAEDQAAVTAAVQAAERALTNRSEGEVLDVPPPRTIGRAAARNDADVALISVPGPNAYVEAAEALRAGLHVMVFSNNVPVAAEQALKREGAERGLLVMGPDCGTAIVSGVGFGFANAVSPGPVGIVGASGTGIQQLCCLLADAGIGVRHAIGTGSRDLSSEVGGAATLQGLAALDRDPAVAVIAVVSKPPAPEVAAHVRAAATACATPTVTVLLGEETIEEGAAGLIAKLGHAPVAWPSWTAATMPRRRGVLRGLFSGGTLCAEAAMVVSKRFGPVGDRLDDTGHTMVDMGADEFTRGRPHPMIDQRFRLDQLAFAAADDDVAVILMDVVLGYGAHPDPASELAPGIERAVARGIPVVVSLCGTEADPQNREAQAHILVGAGAVVHASNAAAARAAMELVGGGGA
jgi:FdrA protein